MIPPAVVLAAVDFSEPSHTAVAFAARLAHQAGAALHVICAEDPLLAEAARHAGIDLARDTSEELARFVASALAAGQAPPGRHVATGPAVDVILAAAERHRADVIVLGSHGMSGAERLIFGSTTEGVLRRASVSVLVTPPVWSPATATPDLSGTGPVIAGVDLGEPSRSTLEAACRLAAMLGTSVEAVHVVPNPPVLARWRDHAENAARERVAAARNTLDAFMQSVGCAVPVRGVVEAGVVHDRLAALCAAAPERSPILVLGRNAAHGRTGPPGAIAYRMLSLARVPVLMHVNRE